MPRSYASSILAGLLVTIFALPESGSSQCLNWSDAFAAQQPEVDRTYTALAIFDDGTGPALYAGGNLGPTTTGFVRRWDGTSWSDLAYGEAGSSVWAMAVFDDGNGPALYVGGTFGTLGGTSARNLARWRGSWSAVGSGVGDASFGNVSSLAVLDFGGGPALFIGGAFATAGGVAANSVVRWDGFAWTPLGPGIGATPGVVVRALTLFDDGSGPAVYAGGSFTSAGGSLANRIARWDGASWSSLGSGMNQSVMALAVFDDGLGPALYAGGAFSTAGGTTAGRIAKWNGTSWAQVGGGVDDTVQTLLVANDATGLALYAGGHFAIAGGAFHKRIARWDGSAWSGLANGIGYGSPNALVGLDDGSGVVEIHAAGSFSSAGSVLARDIARWDGSNWFALGPAGSGMGMDDAVRALHVFDDGAGPALYAGGDFTIAGAAAAGKIAKWNGSAWSGLGAGLGDHPSYAVDTVCALAVFDDGTGPGLYAGGRFRETNGAPGNYIARWNGSSWSPLGTGMNAGAAVYSLAVFDDGGGPALYAGGVFSTAGGVAVQSIAKWNGTNWSPLGAGIQFTQHNLFTSGACAMAVFDDGGGPALYVGGYFHHAGGVPAASIAKWNGSSWSPVGGGIVGGTPSFPDGISALTVFDDGSGPALYAGGHFQLAGGIPANGVAKWNGASWSSVAGGISGDVYAMSVFDDGEGPALCCGGLFFGAGGGTASNIAKWDGQSWSAFGSGISSQNSKWVRALANFDAGSGAGASLFAGGSFIQAANLESQRIASWRGCTSPVDTFCFGDGSVATCPCFSVGLPGRGCDNSQHTGGARLDASGTTVPDTLVLHATSEMPTALTIFLQGDVLVPGSLAFGDGRRCFVGHLERLYKKSASGGSVSAPGSGELSITARSAVMGDPIASGDTRYYMTYYRDPNPSFCPYPAGSTFNCGNAVRVVW